MSENTSYTTEEIARLLKISKLKVYDLIKKESCPPTVSANRCVLTSLIWRHTSRIPAAAGLMGIRSPAEADYRKYSRCRRPLPSRLRIRPLPLRPPYRQKHQYECGHYRPGYVA